MDTSQTTTPPDTKLNVAGRGSSRAWPEARGPWGARTSRLAQALQRTWQEIVLSRPLVPAAASFTVGVLLMRWGIVSGASCVLTALALLMAPVFADKALSRSSRPLLLLAWCVIAGALWYGLRTVPRASDIGQELPEQGRWTWVRLRVLEWHHLPARQEPLRSWQIREHSTALARAEAVLLEDQWKACAGVLRVTFANQVTEVGVGDRLEVFGELVPVLPPGNPGEDSGGFSDYARGISARFYVRSYQDNARILQRARWYDVPAQMARIQAFFQRRLAELLPSDIAGLAQALLLGEMAQVETERLWRYQRTGVIHVLAISGQHLVILCGFALYLGRSFGASPRRLSWWLLGLVWWYALLTGARPATVRAAVMVTTWCLAQRWARPAVAVNSLALAWLVVGIWDPRDWFQLGCQLSFLSALVLYTVAPSLQTWLHRLTDDPLARLEPSNTAARIRQILTTWLYLSLLVGGTIWLVIAPCLAARVHLISPSSIWLTPILVPLASVALVCGLGLLLSMMVPGVSWVLACAVTWSLRSTEGILALAERVPVAFAYVPGPSTWWLVGFYVVVLVWLLVPGWLAAWRGIWSGLLMWGLFGWVVSLIPSRAEAVHLAFLDVGHGCCVVVKCPDGRTWLYDAGSLQGPEVAERVIAPYLWSQGIRKLDAVILSHGDLDHYNALPRLIQQFRIGTVYVNPSFWEKGGPATQLVREVLDYHGISWEVLAHRVPAPSLNGGVPSDDTHSQEPLAQAQLHGRWFASQPPESQILSLQVLHPPPQGPRGPENARSLVLVLRCANRQVLLTGDLEEPGLSQVLSRLPRNVDVLWAPHHGSPSANTPQLAQACRPGLVIIGCARRDRPDIGVYRAGGATVWQTWREGAILVRIDKRGLHAETYRTGKIWARSAQPENRL